MKTSTAARLLLSALLSLISVVGYGQQTYYYEFLNTTNDKKLANPFGTVNGNDVVTKTATLGAVEWSATSSYLYSNGQGLSVSTATHADEEVLLETTNGLSGTISAIEVKISSTKGDETAKLSAAVGGNDYGTAYIKQRNTSNEAANVCTFSPSSPSSGKVSLRISQDKNDKRGIIIWSIKIVYGDVALTMAEESDNSAILSENNGKTASVKISRSFTADGGWYTLCLPFSLTSQHIEKAFGAGASVEAMTGIQKADGSTTYIDFTPVSATQAGKAYLVKPTVTVENPLFENVTISNAAPTATVVDGYQFIGVYSPTTVDADEYHRLLSGADGLTLRKVAADNTKLKATRGYFVFPQEQTQEAKIHVGEATNINGVGADGGAAHADSAVYTLQGVKISGNGLLPKGVYIRQGKKILVR